MPSTQRGQRPGGTAIAVERDRFAERWRDWQVAARFFEKFALPQSTAFFLTVFLARFWPMDFLEGAVTRHERLRAAHLAGKRRSGASVRIGPGQRLARAPAGRRSAFALMGARQMAFAAGVEHYQGAREAL